jgi:hypothetical protein
MIKLDDLGMARVAVLGLADRSGCASALPFTSRRRIVAAVRGNGRVGEDNK